MRDIKSETNGAGPGATSREGQSRRVGPGDASGCLHTPGAVRSREGKAAGRTPADELAALELLAITEQAPRKYPDMHRDEGQAALALLWSAVRAAAEWERIREGRGAEGIGRVRVRMARAAGVSVSQVDHWLSPGRAETFGVPAMLLLLRGQWLSREAAAWLRVRLLGVLVPTDGDGVGPSDPREAAGWVAKELGDVFAVLACGLPLEGEIADVLHASRRLVSAGRKAERRGAGG